MPATTEDLAKLVVRLEADVRKYQRDLDKATGATSTATRKMEREFDRMRKRQSLSFSKLAAASGVGNIAADMVTALPRIVGATVEWGGAIADVADKTRLTSDTVQELSFALSQAGGSFADVLPGMRGFNDQIAQARGGHGDLLRVLNLMGISLKDSQGGWKDNDQILAEFMSTLGKVDDEQARLALASKAFPARTAAAFAAASVGFEEMATKAHATGQVLDAEAVQKLDAVEDRWNAFKTFIANSWAYIASVVITKATEFINYLTAQFPQLAEWADKPSKFADAFSAAVTSAAADVQRLIAEIKKIGDEIQRIRDLIETPFRNFRNWTQLFKNLFSGRPLTEGMELPPLPELPDPGEFGASLRDSVRRYKAAVDDATQSTEKLDEAGQRVADAFENLPGETKATKALDDLGAVTKRAASEAVKLSDSYKKATESGIEAGQRVGDAFSGLPDDADRSAKQIDALRAVTERATAEAEKLGGSYKAAADVVATAKQPEPKPDTPKAKPQPDEFHVPTPDEIAALETAARAEAELNTELARRQAIMTDAILATDQDTQALKDQAFALSLSEHEATKFLKQVELLNAARAAGLDVTPQLVNGLEQLSTAYADAAEQARQAAENHQQLEAILSEVSGNLENAFVDAILNGEKLEDVIKNLTKSLLEMALRAQLSNLFGTIFGNTNLFASVGKFLGTALAPAAPPSAPAPAAPATAPSAPTFATPAAAPSLPAPVSAPAIAAPTSGQQIAMRSAAAARAPVVQLNVVPGQLFVPTVARISGNVAVQTVSAAGPRLSQAAMAASREQARAYG